MINVTDVEAYGFETAIRGMRNPMNSWHLSDTVDGVVGDKDLDLMKRLNKAGEDHGKFMRMINVSMDINAPLYWWKEFDTYKVGTVANSCSTMHKIHAKQFTVEDFSHDKMTYSAKLVLKQVVVMLNLIRRDFLKTNDKEYWYSMIQLLPSSYNQKRTVTLNYAVLKKMYQARKNHKLGEWVEFCKQIENLPFAYLITMEY